MKRSSIDSGSMYVFYRWEILTLHDTGYFLHLPIVVVVLVFFVVVNAVLHTTYSLHYPSIRTQLLKQHRKCSKVLPLRVHFQEGGANLVDHIGRRHRAPLARKGQLGGLLRHDRGEDA